MSTQELQQKVRDYNFVTIDAETQHKMDTFIGWVYDEINKQPKPKKPEPIVFWIDLFCGAGGTSTGVHLAGQKNMFVAACVNHDANAINSHGANHPFTVHFTEDIKDFEVVRKLRVFIERLRIEFPGCIVNLWASLECTNFSNAKGGQSRDADSRSLADHMPMYLEALRPNYFWIENVVEFMAWGPLDAKGKPESRTAGKDYIRWVEMIKSHGYKFDRKILNSADFGAYQSRKRLFIQFASKNMPIAWPEQTHTKDKRGDNLFDTMPKWKPVREVLDLQDEGASIFNRKKPRSENTLKRIYAGLEKFVAKGESGYTKQYNSGSDQQYGNSKPASIELPCGALTGNPKFAIVKPQFVMNQYSGGGQHTDIDGPAATVTNVPKSNLISAEPWIMPTNFENVGRSIDDPAMTLTGSRRHPYLVNANSSTSPPLDIDSPSPSITSRTHLLINPSWFGHVTSTDEPSVTIVARQDKAPLYLMTAESGPVIALVYEDDSETMIKIKIFMVEHAITDIKMRMLKIPELKKIQGFPENYVLIGTQTEQKKYIGNAVEVTMASALTRTNYQAISKIAA